MNLEIVLVMMIFHFRSALVSGIASRSKLSRTSTDMRQFSRRWSTKGTEKLNECNENVQVLIKKCLTAEDIEAVGEEISPHLGPGDVLLLRGDLGAGKTCFARGLIRKKNGDSEMIVTSPSYLLDNTYDMEDGGIIHHMDLYRLPNGCDMTVLGIPQIFKDSLCLIEWPQRMSKDIYPEDYLDVELKILQDESREIRFMTSPHNAAGWTNKLSALL